MGTVPVSVTGETLPFDIAAALTDAGDTLTISVVNPIEEARNLPVSVVGGEVAEEGRAHVITGAHDMVYNDLENKDRVDTTTRTVSMENEALRIPAASATILQLDL